jgi:integrase
MGRPRNKDGIRITTRARDGIQLVHFEEHPGHWIASKTTDREKALKWARQNCSWLIGRTVETMAYFCRGFYAPDGKWVRKQKEKGHSYGDLHLRNRQAYLDNYVISEFGDIDPREIKRVQIDDWLLDLQGKSGKKKLSGATRNKIIYSLQDVFEYLIDLEILQTNPLTGLRKYSKDPKNPRGVIDRASLAKLFPLTHGAAVRIWGSSMWAAMMMVFIDTGSRPNEVRALTWKEIDIAKRFIPIRKGIEAGTADKIKGTKTGVVKAGFLAVRTIQELEIWRAESRWNADDDFVFTVAGRAPVTDEATLKAFRRGVARAKAEHDRQENHEPWEPNPAWTTYWLRHSFGTYQMENLSDEEISSLMGNGVVVLRQHYQHPDDETLYRKTRGIQEKLDQAREG